MKRAALYVRVSTKDQTAENQERELRAWAERLGLDGVRVFAETGSGARADRETLSALLEAAHRREFDVLLVWALDRLSREGIAPMACYLETFKGAGVRVLSHQEPWLDTAGPVGELLVAIFAWVAKQERARLAERVRAGLERARERGTRSGRPIGRPSRHVDIAEVHRRRAYDQSWRTIARALKTPVRTLRRAVMAGQKARAKSAPQGPLSTHPGAPAEGQATT